MMRQFVEHLLPTQKGAANPGALNAGTMSIAARFAAAVRPFSLSGVTQGALVGCVSLCVVRLRQVS